MSASCFCSVTHEKTCCCASSIAERSSLSTFEITARPSDMVGGEETGRWPRFFCNVEGGWRRMGRLLQPTLFFLKTILHDPHAPSTLYLQKIS